MDFIWNSLDFYRRLLRPRQQASDDGLLVSKPDNCLPVATPDNCLLVAAIDFGTTYSGWGFSFKHEFHTDPTKISVMDSSSGKTISHKGPTCILIKPDGRTIEAFGYEAETRYSELIEEGEHTKWYYFHRFKMMLWNKPIHRDTMLDDECGKSLPALRVFALSIRHMMGGVLEVCKMRVDALNEKDINWVLSVPAIWNDSAKHFMRLAAQEAGIEKDKLTIALEPEAASICCRHTKLHNEGVGGISAFQSGKKYLVVDAGGGTIDMTVHEVCFGGALKELHKATGGAWGGTMVDKAFLDFIAELIGKDAFNAFKDQHKEDYIGLLRDFELKKRGTDLQSERRVTITIPLSMTELVNDIQRKPLEKVVHNSSYAKSIKLINKDKLRLDNGLFRTFFMESVDKIVQHVSEILKTPEADGVDTILMVGGYSESRLLHDTLQKEFQEMKIIVPPDAGLAVLKGAVMFGHCPTFIKERVSKFTYGIDVAYPFDEKVHPVDKRLKTDFGVRCKDIFDVLVSAGQRLVVGEKQYSKKITVQNTNQSSFLFHIYSTTRKDVQFVTDAGCTEIGSITIPISGSGLNRSVLVQALFGGSEIMIEVKETSTGRITRTCVDFV